MNPNPTYYPTGEFAKLCHTTKETLFHYDAIGLLKPAIVRKNGYRYYSFEQYFVMGLISALKSTGTSLKDIQDYMRDKNSEKYLKLLSRKKAELALEQKRLAQIQQEMSAAIWRTREGIKAMPGIPRIEKTCEEYYVITPLENMADEKAYLKDLALHLEYCESHQLSVDFTIGTILSKELLEKKDYDQGTYLSSKCMDKLKSPRIHIRPSGTYAIIEHKGFYDSLSDAYKILLEFIDGNHLTIIGNSYENDLLSYLSCDNMEDYVIQIAIQVNKQ